MGGGGHFLAALFSALEAGASPWPPPISPEHLDRAGNRCPGALVVSKKKNDVREIE